MRSLFEASVFWPPPILVAASIRKCHLPCAALRYYIPPPFRPGFEGIRHRAGSSHRATDRLELRREDIVPLASVADRSPAFRWIHGRQLFVRGAPVPSGSDS